MSIVISVEQVSKAYRLGQIGGGTLKEDFARWRSVATSRQSFLCVDCSLSRLLCLPPARHYVILLSQ